MCSIYLTRGEFPSFFIKCRQVDKLLSGLWAVLVQTWRRLDIGEAITTKGKTTGCEMQGAEHLIICIHVYMHIYICMYTNIHAWDETSCHGRVASRENDSKLCTRCMARREDP